VGEFFYFEQAGKCALVDEFAAGGSAFGAEFNDVIGPGFSSPGSQ